MNMFCLRETFNPRQMRESNARPLRNSLFVSAVQMAVVHSFQSLLDFFCSL
jgi:hypothetical protein